jgi:hypothetical protein
MARARAEKLSRGSVAMLATAVLLLVGVAAPAHAQTPEQETAEALRRRHVETFPIMALFDVYSVQYAYRAHPRFEAIVGVAYVNVKVRDRSDTVIGRMHAPTRKPALVASFASRTRRLKSRIQLSSAEP